MTWWSTLFSPALPLRERIVRSAIEDLTARPHRAHDANDTSAPAASTNSKVAPAPAYGGASVAPAGCAPPPSSVRRKRDASGSSSATSLVLDCIGGGGSAGRCLARAAPAPEPVRATDDDCRWCAPACVAARSSLSLIAPWRVCLSGLTQMHLHPGAIGASVLFLDVDGVLNTCGTWRRAPGGGDAWEPVLVERLARLVETTGAVLVLSSKVCVERTDTLCTNASPSSSGGDRSLICPLRSRAAVARVASRL